MVIGVNLFMNTKEHMGNAFFLFNELVLLLLEMQKKNLLQKYISEYLYV